MKLIRLSLILSLVTVLGIFGTSSTPYVGAAYDIPDWVETLAGMWFSGNIDDETFGTALDWLIDNQVLTTPSNPVQGSITGSTFTNSTGTYQMIGSDMSTFTNSTGTYQVIDSSMATFTNSTGTYQLNKKLSDEGTWLWHMNTSIFTNSTGTYMQTPLGTYMIYQ